jgi:hypothetical protein
MQIEQVIRRFGARISAGFASLLHPSMQAGPPIDWRLRPDRATFIRLGIAAVIAVVLYYLLGALWNHKIDDDPRFTAAKQWTVEGGSITVSVATSLLDREVNHNGWVANAPFYLPTALLHNMASYQTGIVQAVLAFTEAVSQGLAARGAPSVDLAETVTRLRKRPDVWSWSLSEPLGYLGNSQADYSEGLLDLNGYNVALADHTSQFPHEPAMLALILARFSHDLDEAARALEIEADFRPFLLSRRIGDAFYRARGLAYCDAMLMRGLHNDFAAVITERKLEAQWAAAEAALMRAANFSPLFVVNGAPANVMFPAHPLAMGYFALAARSDLHGVIAVLN